MMLNTECEVSERDQSQVEWRPLAMMRAASLQTGIEHGLFLGHYLNYCHTIDLQERRAMNMIRRLLHSLEYVITFLVIISKFERS